MVSPVWLDGSLAGHQHEVSAAAVDEGMYRSAIGEVYTFTLVNVLEHRLVVASVANGIPSPAMLFGALMTPEAQRAQS